MADYAVSTTNIWPNYAAGNKSGNNAGQDHTLGKDQFLKILLAQISNQDPTKPLEDKEFIAQMAQFTSVEQLSNMAKSLEGLTQSIGLSSSLIGKSIGWEVESTGDNAPVVVAGIVDSITVKSGTTFAVVDGEEIAIGRIISVANPAPESGGSEQEGEKTS